MSSTPLSRTRAALELAATARHHHHHQQHQRSGAVLNNRGGCMRERGVALAGAGDGLTTAAMQWLLLWMCSLWMHLGRLSVLTASAARLRRSHRFHRGLLCLSHRLPAFFLHSSPAPPPQARPRQQARPTTARRQQAAQQPASRQRRHRSHSPPHPQPQPRDWAVATRVEAVVVAVRLVRPSPLALQQGPRLLCLHLWCLRWCTCVTAPRRTSRPRKSPDVCCKS